MPAVADGDDEVGAGEDHDLAGGDDLAGRGEFLVLDVADRLEHGEQDVAVPLHLGALMGLDGVLDGERVQAEQFGDAGELRLGGFVQAEPDEAAVVLADAGDGLLDGRGGVLAHTVPVDHTVDDGRAERRTGGMTEIHPPPRTPSQAGHFTQAADHRHAGAPWLGPDSVPGAGKGVVSTSKKQPGGERATPGPGPQA